MCKKAETLEIRFTDLKNRDVQRDDLDKSNNRRDNKINYNEAVALAEDSFFRNVYNQALEQVAMIVRQNENSKNNHDILNIIAFTGRRGTGKTSAMLSFADFLTSHSIDFNLIDDVVGSVDFKLLADIDAATLDKHVNIIPAIISEIIREIERELRNFNSCADNSDRKYSSAHSLYDRANGLFNDYLTGIGALSKRSDASNYLSVTAKRLSFESDFREFIRDYVDFSFAKNNKAYFIICIDDVDMAPCKHAELLKSIHQYLMIPNVIIMLTANLKFLLPELQTVFYNNITPAFFGDSIDMISREQTDDYLKKIIPSDNRIILPSWKKKDYLTMFPIYINFGTKFAKKDLSDCFSELQGSQFYEFLKLHQIEPYRITPKQFILMMIANRTKVYYDINGQKYHFFEPTSLRSLYDLFFILYNMKNIVSEYEKKDEEKPSDYYLHRSQNRKRLLDYIHFTMRRDFCFSDNENAFIDKLLALPLERRGIVVWEHYYNLLFKNEVRNKIDSSYGEEFRASEVYHHSIIKYSFGEFFRVLFTSSRLGVFSNNFIKFLLATYSIALPAFVEKEKKDYNEGKGDYKNLVHLFGGSLLGNWRDELFGCQTEVYQENNGNKLITAYQSNRCSIVVEKPNDKKVNISHIEVLFCFLLLSPNWVNQKPIRVDKQDNKYTIKAELDPTSFLINGLLIGANVRNKYGFGNSINGHFPFKLYDDLGTCKYLTLSGLIKEIYGGFTISSENKSENNGAELPEYVNSYSAFIYKNIKRKTTIDNNRICKPSGSSKTGNTNKIYSNDIVEKILDYLSGDYKTYHLSNMLKHIDLTYNSIKRAITDIVYVTPEYLNKKQWVDTKKNAIDLIQTFYSNLNDQLIETDKVYFAEETKASNSFAARFMNCAIYKCIDKYEDKGIRLECFTETESADAEDIELDELLDQLLDQYFQEFDSVNVKEFIRTLFSLMIFELNERIRITEDQSENIISVLLRYVSEINNVDEFENDFILNQAKNARQDIREILGLEKNANTT